MKHVSPKRLVCALSCDGGLEDRAFAYLVRLFEAACVLHGMHAPMLRVTVVIGVPNKTGRVGYVNMTGRCSEAG